MVQQPAPDIKKIRGDFPVVVKAAENEAILWQTLISAGLIGGGNVSMAVVDLIRVRQIDNLFGVAGLVLRRDEHGIGNQIVDKRRAKRAGIPQKMHLDRRRSGSQNAQPGILRVALEIDGYINLKLTDDAGDFGIGFICDYDELIKGSTDPLTHLIVR